MQHVFISYCRRNQTFAESLEDKLQDNGFETWIDTKNIPGGVVWLQALRDGMDRSGRVVVCLTPDAIESEWVQNEVFLAQVSQKMIIPIMVIDCYEDLKNNEKLKYLLNVQIIDFYNKDYEIAFNQLLIALRRQILRPVLERFFEFSDSKEFQTIVEKLGSSAKRIVMIGTGLNLLRNDLFLNHILERASSGACVLEVYMADPTSPAVETRLIEEEAGPDLITIGQDGISRQIKNLLIAWRNANSSDSIRINLFRHYPTFALVILDNEYFIYPYAYAKLGNFSPVFQFTKTNPPSIPLIDFLDQQYERIKADSLPAHRVQEIRAASSHHQVDMSTLKAMALYFVPAAGTPLYKFGTGVLGYDIWKPAESPKSPWADQVGVARTYGMHLTVADALYFLSDRELEQIITEIRFVLRDLPPFELTDLEIQPDFPGPQTISIHATDLSGTLEILNHELTHRMYRRAIASNYSFEPELIYRLPKQPVREKLMIRRYHAPYILQRYVPHFTLLKHVEPEEQAETVKKLSEEFVKQVPHPTIYVDRLAVMVRPNPKESWKILTEIPFAQ